MIRAKHSLAVMLCLMLLVLMSGCSGGAVSVNIPPQFSISNPGNPIDFRNEIVKELTRTPFGVIEGSNAMAFIDNDIASLDELYLVTVAVEGFELTALHISRHTVVYFFRCIDSAREVTPTLNEVVTIAFRRLENNLTPDEAWRIVMEQSNRSGRARTTESGMIYREDLNSISSRIGDTWLNIRVPDRLNSYEFLRDLALEVIATSELIVLDDILAEPVVYG
ncbi:MAG: hypothetical protein FWB75_05440 [Oscillospiraceae bacterium]|nr:hypothetical protein [Oscillospiraceae bacterium]